MVARVPRPKELRDAELAASPVEAKPTAAAATPLRNMALGVPLLASALRPPVASSLAVKAGLDAAVACAWRPQRLGERARQPVAEQAIAAAIPLVVRRRVGVAVVVADRRRKPAWALALAA